jgi:hypothetical protein
VIDQAVLIAGNHLLSALKARLVPESSELLAFADSEALRALEVITTKRPALVALERNFAATPRGAALINRIKADPSLAETEIRIVTADGGTQPAAIAVPQAPVAAAANAERQAPAELDYRGTRRSPRFGITGSREILVDGKRGSLVDLSTGGAQLITATILKPNQRVRVSLPDDEGAIRCSATVVWASFEIPKGTNPHYRAGLEFIEPDTRAIDAFARRHGQPD